MNMKSALTIAGSDSGGGAGVQADLKTMSAFKVFGMSAIVAITAQNTQTVSSVFNLPLEMIQAQIDTVFEDIQVDAVKIGMLSTAEIISTVAESLRKWKPAIIVLDPVMISKSGCALLQEDAVQALKNELLPLASLITPNVPEAEVLAGIKIVTKEDMRKAAEILLATGTKAVLLKGGHCEDHADDLLFSAEQELWLKGERIESRNTHGTGCTLSSAITALLAREYSLEESCREGKAFVRRAMSAGLDIGQGCGPLHHFVDWY